MPIFGFGKKDDEKIDIANIRRSNTGKIVVESREDEFSELDARNDFMRSKSLPEVDIINHNIKLNVNIDDDIEDISSKIDVQFNSENSNIKLDQVKLDVTNAYKEDLDINKIRQEIFKEETVLKPVMSLVNTVNQTTPSVAGINITIPETVTAKPVVPEIKPVAKVEDVKKEVSLILEFATSRPADVIYDLPRFAEEPIFRLDLHATDLDLAEFVKANPNIRYLDISNCSRITNFAIIANLINLEELDLSGCRNLVDISFLSNLKKLRVLNLGATGIESVDNFPKLPNLQVLNLKMNKISSINGLRSCEGLHDLVLWGCIAIDDISVVQNFLELRLLDIESCGLISNISSIKNLRKMVYLNLNLTRVDDLSPIKDLTDIELFTMDSTPLAMTEKNLTYFENLSKMKFLGLRSRVIRNLSYFRNMLDLAELEISSNAISDLRPLENMTKMQAINLAINPSLTDLSPLHNMKSLEKLFISGFKVGKEITVGMLIDDISVVKNMPNLKIFESACNKKLKDISPLQNCSKLEEIVLSDSFGISDVTPLRFCKNLVEVSLENCSQIKDISFIKYCTKLRLLNVQKTSIDRALLSDLKISLNLVDFRDDGSTPLLRSIIGSIKFRRKMTKIGKGTMKKEDK